MKQSQWFGIAVAAVVGLVVLSQSVFEVTESKQAIVLQFGQPKHIITSPGLNVKVPFIQKVLFFDKRLLCLEGNDGRAESIVLGDSKRVMIEAVTMYRIVDPLLFYQRVRDERELRRRLFTIVDSSQRLVLGKSTLATILSDKRQDLMNAIQVEVNNKTKDLGIEVQDVRIKSAELPQENTDAIVQRMKTEREAVATDIRSRGAQRAEEIQAGANRQANVIVADAEKLAQEVRGEGDRVAGLIYSEATGVDKDFYEFYRSLQAYQLAFSNDDTPMVLTPANAFMKGFGEYLGAKESGSVAPKSGDFSATGRISKIESLANDSLKNIPSDPLDKSIEDAPTPDQPAPTDASPSGVLPSDVPLDQNNENKKNDGVQTGPESDPNKPSLSVPVEKSGPSSETPKDQ